MHYYWSKPLSSRLILHSACHLGKGGCTIFIRPSASSHLPHLITTQSYLPHSSLSTSTNGLGNPLDLLSNPNIQARLDSIVDRVKEIQLTLTHERDPFSIARLSRDLSNLGPVSELVLQLKSTQQSLDDLKSLFLDPEMRSLALEEQTELLESLQSTAKLLISHLLPKDVDDNGSAVLEIRAGAGGSESALFVRDLYEMYERYAQMHGWQFKPASITEADGAGGYKDATATIMGPSVYRKLKLESGVHRVQRVPETESQGRIHTSTVTVAILPLPEQVERLVDIPEKDLRIDVYRSSGAGGQHVNTTESAVRITHLPTGLVVAIQDERSQHKNKAKAMSIIRAKIYDLERRRAQEKRRDARRSQIGSGDRSERIRTYNFPQSRVTDHRIGVTVHDLPSVLTGVRLSELIEALSVRAELEQLELMVEQ